MALTGNETAWATTTVQLIISCAFGALIAWITIKAQHAKSMEEIQRAVKNIFARLTLWIANLSAGASLVWQFFSSSPISRKEVFLIIWSFGIIFLSVILRIYSHLIWLAKKQAELDKIQCDHTGRLIGIVEENLMPNQKKSPAKKRR